MLKTFSQYHLSIRCFVKRKYFAPDRLLSLRMSSGCIKEQNKGKLVVSVIYDPHLSIKHTKWQLYLRQPFYYGTELALKTMTSHSIHGVIEIQLTSSIVKDINNCASFIRNIAVIVTILHQRLVIPRKVI